MSKLKSFHIILTFNKNNNFFIKRKNYKINSFKLILVNVEPNTQYLFLFIS